MSLTKLSLAGNNLIISGQGEFGYRLIVTSRLGTGNWLTFFTVYRQSPSCHLKAWSPFGWLRWLQATKPPPRIISVMRVLPACTAEKKGEGHLSSLYSNAGPITLQQPACSCNYTVPSPHSNGGPFHSNCNYRRERVKENSCRQRIKRAVGVNKNEKGKSWQV